VTVKSARLSHVEAASVPIGALTAWQGLFDRAKLQAGDRILIHGGSGGVDMSTTGGRKLHEPGDHKFFSRVGAGSDIKKSVFRISALTAPS
jgi:hypothetical protein